MKANRRSGTKPEVALRSALHRRGMRYRKDHLLRFDEGIKVRPDIVFTARKIAVFVDGCFWHGCPQHRTHPRTNATYWAEKIEGNIARDVETTARLEAAGWTVLRYWQHEDPLAVASAIATEVCRP